MKLLAPLLAASLALCANTAFAQTTETTTTTTTIETTEAVNPIVLPAGVSYKVVDPAKSVIIGEYVVGQTYTPGYYVIDETSGKVVATVSDAGKLVALGTMPSVLPHNFLVIDGTLVYFSTDYAFRRAKLEQEVANDYAAGRLTHDQTRTLRQKLALIASLETKRKSDLTYSKGTMKSIEKKFAEVETYKAKYVASTNTKKAKIGIRVE